MRMITSEISLISYHLLISSAESKRSILLQLFLLSRPPLTPRRPSFYPRLETKPENGEMEEEILKEFLNSSSKSLKPLLKKKASISLSLVEMIS